MKKQQILIPIFLILALALGFGAGRLIAAGSAGSKDDPLVTVSYLNEVFKPALAGELAQKLAAAEAELAAALDVKIAAANPDGAGARDFVLVSFRRGQTLTLAEGSEALLREGAATAAGALTDTSTGAAVSAGESVQANHMYLAAANSAGLTAASDTAAALVRGTYALK